MDGDALVESYLDRLSSHASAIRARAADEATDGVSDWGRHAYTRSQAQRLSRGLVDALSVESDDEARESILNALCSFVKWDLAPTWEVTRALALHRRDADPLGPYWEEIEDWARRHEE